MMEKKGFRRLVFVGDFLDYPQGGLARPKKRSKKNPIQVKRVVRTMVKSLIRIRQNPDERLSNIANRWKMEKEFAASSYDTMLKAFTVAAILFVFARRKSKPASQLPCCMKHLSQDRKSSMGAQMCVSMVISRIGEKPLIHPA